jgi:hypothetical protein
MKSGSFAADFFLVFTGALDAVASIAVAFAGAAEARLSAALGPVFRELALVEHVFHRTLKTRDSPAQYQRRRGVGSANSRASAICDSQSLSFEPFERDLLRKIRVAVRDAPRRKAPAA